MKFRSLPKHQSHLVLGTIVLPDPATDELQIPDLLFCLTSLISVVILHFSFFLTI